MHGVMEINIIRGLPHYLTSDWIYGDLYHPDLTHKSHESKYGLIIDEPEENESP